MAKGMNMLSLKRINRGLVLQLLATGVCSSRVEIAQKSHLTKMAISKIMNEYIDMGIVEESSKTVRATRSTPIQLSLSASAPKVLGLLLHRTHCQAAICDLSMGILDTLSVTLPEEYTAESLLEFLFAAIDPFLLRHPDVAGIGIGSIGPINSQSGVILNPPHFQNIRDFHIRDLFWNHYKLPVFVDHHYNCAALAERYYGNGRDHSNLLYLGISDGISMGVICGGKLFNNYNGYSSEIGHVTVDCNGPRCICGKQGCLSVYARPSCIIKAVESSPLIGTAMTFREICDNSSTAAIDQIIMTQMIHPLIYALSSAVNLLNPDLILLGDEAALLPDRYLGYLEQRLNEVIFTHNYHHVSVRRAMLPQKYNAAMCASTVLDQIFRGKLSLTNDEAENEEN